MVGCKKFSWSIYTSRKLFSTLRKSLLESELPRCKRQLSRSFHVTPVKRLILSPQEVTDILRQNEFSTELPAGPVKSYETNQVAANLPIEDYTSEVKCNLTSGYLFGVFDGHGGRSCSNVTSKRLFQYMAASLLPAEILSTYMSSSDRPPLIEYFDPKKAQIQFVSDLQDIYTKSFDQYLHALSAYTQDTQHNLDNILQYACDYFDKDLSQEVLENYEEQNKIDLRLLDIATSGSVACVAYIDGHHLHVVNTGDCCAVMGSVSEENDWFAKKLCNQHSFENTTEVNRLNGNHINEQVIRSNRLLGQLAPLRAFGDYRYKWDRKKLEEIVVPIMGNIIPNNYLTPPYLTAIPEIFTYKLTPRDKFIVLATDGLWDVLSPQEVVTLVGEHMLGKVSFTPVQFTNKNINLGEVMEVLEKRQEILQNKPTDRNAATHLIRYAFGSNDSGIISNSRLAQLLSMPPTKARLYRDDISITVIYFDSEFLRNLPE